MAIVRVFKNCLFFEFIRSVHVSGQVFLSEIDNLSAFVTFCSQQQSALDTLGNILKSSEV